MGFDLNAVQSDNFFANLLDWGSKNIVATALGNSVRLWDASTCSASEIVTFDDQTGPVTTLSWSPDGRYIAIGLNNSQVKLWDPTAHRRLRTLPQPVASLAWSGDTLTAGLMDGPIVDNDVRARSSVIGTYRGHSKAVSCLRWSPGLGGQLASGGNDHLVHVWDRSSSSSRWLHRFDRHESVVRSLAWCPFRSDLLASGGGWGDRSIKFWDVQTGACLNSVDTGSKVCGLMWNKNAAKLLSSNGLSGHNQLTLWKYPSMVKTEAKFSAHASAQVSDDSTGVLLNSSWFSQSPDGRTIATAAGNGVLRLIHVFKARPSWKRPEPVYKNLLLCR